MSLSQEERLLLQQKRLKAMRDRVVEETYLSVADVAKHFGLAESTVKEIPIEVLPWSDFTPFSKKTTRRYSPAEVMAAEIRLRRYLKARAEDRGEAYLEELRQELRRDEESVLAFAREARRDVA